MPRTREKATERHTEVVEGSNQVRYGRRSAAARPLCETPIAQGHPLFVDEVVALVVAAHALHSMPTPGSLGALPTLAAEHPAGLRDTSLRAVRPKVGAYCIRPYPVGDGAPSLLSAAWRSVPSLLLRHLRLPQ